jgi:hypothetical protein
MLFTASGTVAGKIETRHAMAIVTPTKRKGTKLAVKSGTVT